MRIIISVLMWHISVISPYNATNGTSTFSFNILHVYAATNGVWCVVIISNITNITTTNEIRSTCSISLNFVLLWIHHLLLFTWVTNNNGTIYFDYTRHIPQSISRCSINNILCIIIWSHDHRSKYVCKYICGGASALVAPMLVLPLYIRTMQVHKSKIDLHYLLCS